MKAFRSTQFLSWFGLGLLLGSAALFTGCGPLSPNQASVSGKVTYKGAPVTGGTLNFAPVSEAGDKGARTPVALKPDGTFSSSEIPTGEMRVSVETDSVKGMGLHQPGGGGVKPPPGVNMPEQPKFDVSKMPTYVPIPAKYKDPKTSGLTCTLKAGSNKLEFDLKD